MPEQSADIVAGLGLYLKYLRMLESLYVDATAQYSNNLQPAVITIRLSPT